MKITSTTHQVLEHTIQTVTAIYTRVSSERQEKGLSLETQLERCIEYCHECGYTVDKRYIYHEVMTGVVYRERPRLTELRAAAKKQMFQVVVVYELDRFARDPIHQAIVKDELEYYGVKLECVRWPIDDSPEGQLVQYTQGLVAKIEYEKIKERTQRGRRARVEKGALYGTNHAKFGYMWGDEKKRTYAYNTEEKPDKSGNEWTEVDIVTRIFDSLDEGVSLRTLASQFTKEGIPTRSGKPYWRAEAITRIAHDQDYTGEAAVYKTRTIKLPNGSKQVERRPKEEWVLLPEGTVPPIVNKIKFVRVQEQLKDNNKFSQRNNQHPHDSLLRYGIAVCGYCNNVMRGKWIASKKWQSATYYQCNAEVGRLGGCEHHPSLKAETLDNAVWEYVKARIEDPLLVEQFIEEQLQNGDPIANDVEAINRSLKKVQDEQQNLLTGLGKLNPVYHASVYQRLNDLAEMQAGLKKDKTELEGSAKTWEEIQEELQEFKEWCTNFRSTVENSATYEEKLRAIKRFNIKVYVYRRDPVTQKPNFKITAKPIHYITHYL
jgi:site-specific DNA recombinase